LLADVEVREKMPRPTTGWKTWIDASKGISILENEEAINLVAEHIRGLTL
jgi:hypothetical protein